MYSLAFHIKNNKVINHVVKYLILIVFQKLDRGENHVYLCKTTKKIDFFFLFFFGGDF